MAAENESFETKDFAWMVAMSILFLLLVVVSGASSAPNGDRISASFLNCSATTAKSRMRATSARGSSRSGFQRSASLIAASPATSATSGRRCFPLRSPSR
jgi:hypothetical protein